MGRRNDWNAVRMVADSIEAGDRSFWNLTKIPDLPTAGWAAIEELEEKGLVKASRRDDRVEPTEAFGPWLAELQTAETEQAIARQKAMHPPWQVPAPDPEPSKPAAVLPAVIERLSQTSLTKARSTNRSRRSPFDRLKPEETLAAKILLTLEERCGFNGRISKRELEREMNANKRPFWSEAWQLLRRDECIRISPGPNRQQFVDQPRIPGYLRPQETAKKPGKARRRRARTEWFKERLPEFLRRDGYDELADAIEMTRWEGEDDVPLQYVSGDPTAR